MLIKSFTRLGPDHSWFVQAAEKTEASGVVTLDLPSKSEESS